MALGAGSIAIVGFNADGTGSFAFVAINPIAAGTVIYFTDKEPATATTLTSGEGTLSWTAPAGGVAPGTVVQVSNTDSGALSVNSGAIAVAQSGFGLAGSSEGLFAFVGTATTPTTYLTAFLTDTVAQVGSASLATIGLTDGVNAIIFGSTGKNGDVYALNEAKSEATDNTPATFFTKANFDIQKGAGDQSNDSTGPEGDFLGDKQSPLYQDYTIAVCFHRGTLIATPSGVVPVEALAIGDSVVTVDGVQPIRWIGRQAYARRFAGPAIMPVCIRAGALGGSLPLRDLYVSPQHAMVVEGMMITALDLVNGSSITQDFMPASAEVTYFNIELAGPDIIFAEGAACESYANHANRKLFHNWQEYQDLYGSLGPEYINADGTGRRRLATVGPGPVLDAVKARLAPLTLAPLTPDVRVA